MLRTLTGFTTRTLRFASLTAASPARRAVVLTAAESSANRAAFAITSANARGFSSKIEGLHPDFQPKKAAVNDQDKATSDSGEQAALSEIKKVTILTARLISGVFISE